jgi:hypothetical protein
MNNIWLLNQFQCHGFYQAITALVSSCNQKRTAEYKPIEISNSLFHKNSARTNETLLLGFQDACVWSSEGEEYYCSNQCRKEHP